MIKEGEHLKGVEPINEKKLKNSDFFKILEYKLGINKKALDYLQKIIDGRDVYDKSGYSGSSTVIIKQTELNPSSYVIKIQPTSNLKEEYTAYKFFYKKGLSSKPLRYFNFGEYELMVVDKIDLPVAGQYFNNYQEIAEFFGKELRKFHDLNLKEKNILYNEKKIFQSKFIKSFDKAINSQSGLIYSSIYMNDYDYDAMRKYLIKNKSFLFDDLVLNHGDFNPNNVFIGKDGIKLIDFKDTGFVDRHYDIFWTMFMIIIFSGILEDKIAITEVENIFLNSYGRDLINSDKLLFFKKFACLYWERHDEITRIDIL